MAYVYDDVTHVYDDMTYVYDDVTCVYDDVQVEVVGVWEMLAASQVTHTSSYMSFVCP